MHQIAYTAPLVFAFASKRPLVAQLDRAPGFEPGCREFESLRAGHLFSKLLLTNPAQCPTAQKLSRCRKACAWCLFGTI